MAVVWSIIDGNLPFLDDFPVQYDIEYTSDALWQISDGDHPYKKAFPTNYGFTDYSVMVWIIEDGDHPYKKAFPTMYPIEIIEDEWVSKNNSVPYRVEYPPMYISYSTDSWKIDDSIPYRDDFPRLIFSIPDINNEWVTECIGKTEQWEEKTWSGIELRYPNYIWNYKGNIYYSYNANQYVLNKTTGEWEPKTWTGIGSFTGLNVWFTGDDVYYSYNANQYVLNKTTGEWEQKTWTGLTPMYGSNIWTDGNSTYYSYNANQYVLNKTTGEWEQKTWNGFRPTYGRYVWNYKGNTYYSNSANQYVLNKTTGEWEQKTWTGLSSFDSDYVWTDGNSTYYCYGSDQYIIDETIDGWVEKDWDISIYGNKIWTDNISVYYTNTSRSDSYVLVIEKITKIPYRIEFPDQYESTNARHFWYIDDDIPFQGGFPPLYESIKIDPWHIDDDIPYRPAFPDLRDSIPGTDIWVSDGDIPYRLDFPYLYESSKAPSPTFWLQYAGYVPYRPWPGKIQIPNVVSTVEIPEIDWTKSMQQTFEYFTVDPETWFDKEQLYQVTSSNHSIDLTSDLRGSATLSTNELLGENYIRTYMVCRQGRYTHRVCLGTYLYMTSDDSFNGIVHTYTMTGYTPLVELQESMPPIGFFIYGQVKKGDEAPIITDEIKKAIIENTRCELEMNVTIPKPLLNNFVAGTDDNWLTVVNNLLSASNEAKYMLTVDEWGTLQLKNSPIVSNMSPKFVYDDSNSSILLPEINTGDDLFQIPNTVELIFVGNTRFRPCRKVVRNEDEASPVSVQNRGREICKRYTISNIAIPASSNPTQEMIEEMIEKQAYTLLETASTIQKTISYSHGYCGTKVGDCVMINYERAGLVNVKAVITSQKINCTPGCQVDETASYTKKYFKKD